MTPQMQQVVSDNPDGVVYVIGNDSFCIAAFNGLRATGFKGTITTIPQCLTDTTRQAVPATFLKGMQIGATSPVDNTNRRSSSTTPSPRSSGRPTSTGASPVASRMFTSLGGFAVANKALTGEVTPQTLIATTKAMPWSVLPGTGGLHFRCNGKADPTQPATCSTTRC